MINNHCEYIAAWLKQPCREALEPKADLIEHINSCSQCRNLIEALFTDLIDRDFQGDNVACDEVEDRLATFVDYERTYGLIAAAQTFPAIWSHTLSCLQCAEAYSLLCRAADLPVVNWRQIAPVSVKASLQTQVRLPAGFVRRLVSFRQKLGVAWGADPSEIAVDSGEEDTGIQVSIHCEKESRISLFVRTEPPGSGAVTLTIGSVMFRQPLDDAGKAELTHLPEDLFADLADDMTITISIE